MMKIKLTVLFILVSSVLTGNLFSQGFNSINSPDGLYVIAVGNSGKLYRSLSSGVSWISYTNGALNMNCVTSYGDDVWIASDNGTVYKTLKTISAITSYSVGSSANLYSVCFTDANTGFACGDGGEVYKTVNGGINWTLSNSGIPSVKLNSVNFRNGSSGKVAGNNGVIYSTTDGGATWTAETSGTAFNLLKIRCFNDSAAAAGEYGSLLLNNGSGWTPVNTKIITDIRGVSGKNMNDIHVCGGGGFIRNNKSGSSGFLNFEINPMLANLTDVFYYDSNKGWAVSSMNSVIIYTTNGGTSWNLPNGANVSLSWSSKPGATGGSLGDNICEHPFNRNTVFTAFSNQIYVSRNRGENWAAVGTTMPSSSTPHTFFVSAADTNVWLCAVESSPDKVMRTTNYGATWTTPPISMNFSSYGEPLQNDPNNPSYFYFAPDGGGFYRSTNNGATFTEISGSYPFRSPCDILVAYDNPNVIFLADGITGSGVADLFKSTNGGVNWTKVFTNPSSSEIPTISASALKSNEYWITNWSGADIYRSTNTGVNWFLNNTNSISGWGSDVCKEDPNVIMTGSWSGSSSVLSTNGGTNWITTTGLNGSGGVMRLIDRGYIVAQAGSNVYKMNMVYTDAPVVPNVDAQALSVGSTGTQIYSSLNIIPSGIVKNNNPAEIASFTVTRRITPGSYVSTKTVTNLGSLLTETVYFDEWTFTSGVTYTIRDSVYISGDVNSSNDVLTGSITPLLGETVYKMNEDFSGVYPPLNWTFQYTGTNYWVYSTVSGYGTGTGSDKYDFWNSPSGTNQSMFTPAFTAASAGDSLQYDYAYAPYTTGTDSLIIETSTNGGTSYTVLVKLQGRASDVIGATNSLKTAATTSALFEPTNSQWLTRKWALPSGTNKIKFRAKSASGNNLYLDNIKVISPSILYTQYNITLVPQGMYNGSGKNMKDTVRVYLRNNTFPYAAADSSVSVIDNVTLVTPCIFKYASTGNYYIQIKHRNSLEVWSKTGGESITKGVTGNYNFTSGISQTFGDNAILVDTKYCIPSGDINQDGIIDASDLSSVENDVAGSVKGYVVTDVTGDNYVDAGDLSIVENNAAVSYGVITP